jgi:hypothetical protein
MYEQIGYQFYDHGDRKFLGRKKRIQAQRRLFKDIEAVVPTNPRHANEIGRTLRGSARHLKTYIEYPLLTFKKNERDRQVNKFIEPLLPIGYSRHMA